MFAVLSLKHCLSVSSVVFLSLIFLEKITQCLQFYEIFTQYFFYFILFYHLIRTVYLHSRFVVRLAAVPEQMGTNGFRNYLLTGCSCHSSLHL